MPSAPEVSRYLADIEITLRSEADTIKILMLLAEKGRQLDPLNTQCIVDQALGLPPEGSPNPYHVALDPEAEEDDGAQ